MQAGTTCRVASSSQSIVDSVVSLSIAAGLGGDDVTRVRLGSRLAAKR